MFGRRRNVKGPTRTNDVELADGQRQPREKQHQVNHNGHKVTKGIRPDGESGRRGIHPWHFLRICFRSSCSASKFANVLWPVVPAAIAIHFARPEQHVTIFVLNYIAMVPAANLLGFAGQELARKLPKVLGIILETFLGGIVEIVLFIVLLARDPGDNSLIPVIRAAILGSILANLLLCLGFCFFVGGMNRDEQEFDEVISEVGSNLLLVAGFGLLIPSAFFVSLRGETEIVSADDLGKKVLDISRIAAIILWIAYSFFLWFQAQSHHNIYKDLLEADEEKDEDRHKDLRKDKLTLVECIVAILLALTFVSMIAEFLVQEIEPIILAHHISDSFMGLILVPVVEKFAEHITAIDEAHDNQMNFALAHVLGATIQTALFNAPLVVVVGWGLHKHMDLNFEVFNTVTLILAIIVVGNFLRDKKSNYLEGALCIMIYVIIAVAAFYYPNPVHGENGTGESGGQHAAEPAAPEASSAPEHAAKLAMRFLTG